MNTTEQPTPRPNVEEIIATIRTRRSQTNGQRNESVRAAIAAEDDLRGNLVAANQHCLLVPHGKGWRGFCNRLLYKLLYELIGQVNTFHADVVRVLNKMVRILEGEDPSVSELSELQRRRVTVMEMFEERLAQYDAMRIDERLRAIEKAIQQNGRSTQSL